MDSIEHKTIQVNGINMHVAIKGPENAPVILFLHGFPELWYSWRHQIEALSSLGYRAVAPDLRGYGDTDAPADPNSYTCLHVVGDLIGLIDVVAPNEEKVFVVGHDWGASMAWYLCLFRPDRVKALVNLSIRFNPRNPNRKVIETMKLAYGDDYYMCRFQEFDYSISIRIFIIEEVIINKIQDRVKALVNLSVLFNPRNPNRKVIETLKLVCGDDYYMCRFQEPGEIEAEFAQIGTEKILKDFFTYRTPAPLFLPKGKGFNGIPLDTPVVLPSWLPEEDVQYYTVKFEQKGFTGGLNYYRNLDRNWEFTAPSTGAQVKVPVKFIVGDQDFTYNSLGAKNYIAKGGFKRDVPFLEELVVMEGVAHFINQERADDINKHIYDFFQKF